jgi:3-hydroxyacyl-CoA dehydrogenase
VSEPVSTEQAGPIGLIRIDNPPVNAASNAVRSGLLAAIRAHEANPGVRAILILCGGRTFIAGADIREFGKPKPPPSISELGDVIEACAKPVVAAVHGTALGGGFEIALACHYRIARADASFGLAEVTLGLIPAAGGSNRVARLAGADAALKLAVGGAPVMAVEAERMGIVDALIDGPLEPAAIAFTERLIAEQRPPRPTRSLPMPAFDEAAFEALAAPFRRRSAGQDAPAAAIASVRRALTLPFDDAIAADREAFMALQHGCQSRALRHAFFAERRAGKVDNGAAPRPIRSVAILGAGTMGGGIAMSFAAAGIPVTLIDRDQESVERGLARIRGNYEASLKRGSVDDAAMRDRLALITGADERAAAAGADLVIEAVFENMDLKKALFANLEAICGDDTILATNTSALDVDAMAAPLKRPERFVGLHFFSPANVMRLVEVVKAETSSPETLATSVALAKRIGKVPVVSGNCDGFIGNRMVAKRGAQVDRLLLQGALPEEVDAALKGFGFPMGPLAINDMSGLDIGYAIRKRRGTPFPVADAVAQSGRLGQKTGAGYYRYEPGSRTPIPDPEIARLIGEVSARLGVARRTFSSDEMVERMLFPLVNEGARILEEGIAARASDVDAVWINGYGFPRWRGGPMFWADETGLPHIAERLAAFAAEAGDRSLEPAPLLQELARSGRSFADRDRDQRSAS